MAAGPHHRANYADALPRSRWPRFGRPRRFFTWRRGPTTRAKLTITPSASLFGLLRLRPDKRPPPPPDRDSACPRIRCAAGPPPQLAGAIDALDSRPVASAPLPDSVVPDAAAMRPFSITWPQPSAISRATHDRVSSSREASHAAVPFARRERSLRSDRYSVHRSRRRPAKPRKLPTSTHQPGTNPHQSIATDSDARGVADAWPARSSRVGFDPTQGKAHIGTASR